MNQPPISLNKTVMVVEDELDIATVLVDYLKASYYDATHFADGAKAFGALQLSIPSLIILDVMLPGMNGIELLRSIRKISNVPVIMLTARVEEIDRLTGLELGADDYMCKPFSPREVVARVKAVLRRSDITSMPQSERRLRVDADRALALLDGKNLELTRKELMLLAALSSRSGQVFSRAQLLEFVYPDDLDVNERALDSHVKNLRKKLADLDPGHDWIRSVYGMGFSLEEN